MKCFLSFCAKSCRKFLFLKKLFHLLPFQGEEQQKLDVIANRLFIDYLRNSFTTCLLVSEEMDTVVEVEAEQQGSFVVCFDPLDGSNNIDCLASIGSIFAIYRRRSRKEVRKDEELHLPSK